MQLANQEAQRLNHEYIGSEHILLGLVKEGGGVASHVLKNLDVGLRKIRLEVEKIVQPGPEMVTMGRLPHTPRGKKVIEHAIEESRLNNDNHVGTEHLLLGLLREGEGIAAQVLMNLGLKLEQVREEVLMLVGKTWPKTKDNLYRVVLDASQESPDSPLQFSFHVEEPAVLHWLLELKEAYIKALNLDKAKEAEDLAGSLRRLHVEWMTTTKRNHLAALKQDVADLEKELGSGSSNDS